MVAVAVALVVVQKRCARLGAYTGQGLGALIREQFSIRVTAFTLVVANVGLVVSEFAGIAATLIVATIRQAPAVRGIAKEAAPVGQDQDVGKQDRTSPCPEGRSLAAGCL